MHRRIKRPHAGQERFFLTLFLILLVLSVLRIIDLLPPADTGLRPVFSVTTPEATIMPEDGVRALEPAQPSEPLRVTCAEATAVSQSLDLRGEAPKILIYQ